jgi:LuxR family maltose regulon positive regulatory protein
LLRLLDERPESGLTLIAAGPGTGKTVLVSDWARARPEPTAWLSLTAADNDPRRFWRMFLLALRSDGGGRYERASSGRGSGSPADVVDALFDEVAGASAPTVMVLDDAHVLHHPDILEGIDRVVRSWRSRLRLIVSARSDPLLPLSRYRMEGQLNEVRAAQLAMTAVEAEALLAEHQVSLPDVQFQTLLRRTEGWTAGLRLSAMRMEGIERPSDFVTEMAVDQGSIGEYLLEEVLDRQPSEVRRLLIETSFLPEVSGSAARVITDIPDAEEILVDLARTNSFVVPLDREHTRFRYHHLLAEMLRYLLHRRPDAAERVLFDRAAGWFAERGDVVEAVTWYGHAGNEAAAAELLVHGGIADAFVRGDDLIPAEFRRLIAPTTAVSSTTEVSPASSVLRLAVAAVSGDRAAGLAVIDRARSGLQRAPDIALALALAEIRVARKIGRWSVVAGVAREMIGDAAPDSQVNTVPGLRAALMLAEASARYWQGDAVTAYPLLRAASVEAALADVPEIRIETLGMLAFCDSSTSRPRHSVAAREQATALLNESSGVLTPVTLQLAEAVDSFAAAELGEVARIIERVRAMGVVDSDAALAGCVVLAEATMLLFAGEVAPARTSIEGCPQLIEAEGLLEIARDSALAEIETALGRPNAALRILDRHHGELAEVRLAVPKAVALLRLGDVRGAHASVRTMLTSTDVSVSRCDVVEALLCDAQVAQLECNESRVVELIMCATEIADGDVIMPFARVADVFVGTLARHPTLAAQWPIAPAADPVVVAHAPAARELPDPLTERERAVLRYLATSMSTAEIAAELFLSVNTIKTHLAAIYRKLAASRRREAVLRARELELL